MPELLAIMAHPDDAELLCGGALLRAADQRYSTGVLDLTAGESGSAGSAETRAAEAAQAARLLGLADRHCAGLHDGELANTLEARRTVAAWIRRLRPRVVITHWPDARHPDHRAASELVRDACFVAGLRRAGIDGEPYRPHKLVYALSYAERAPAPSFVIDITDQLQRKLEAIFAYASQLEGRTALGDIFGGGGRPLAEQIAAHAAHYGSLIRKAYGEPYWTKEALEVGDMVELAVSSF